MKLSLSGSSSSHLLIPFPKHFSELTTALSSLYHLEPKKNLYSLYYVDSDNDMIALSEDEDLMEAERYKRMKGGAKGGGGHLEV